MFLKTTTFNHEAEKFNEALGISEETATRVREIVLFSSFANKYQKDELYPNEDEAPICMNKVSGDMERALKFINTDEEYTEFLMVFRTYQQMALKTIALERVMNSDGDDLDEEVREKVKIMKMVEKIMNVIHKEENTPRPGINDVTKETMFRRIELVKKSGYDFNLYWNLLQAAFDFESIDTLINNIFSNDDDE